MSTTFITSYLTFYLKGRVEYKGDFIEVSQPNTVLKLIPLGLSRQAYPVEQISSVSTDFKVSAGSMLWGTFWAFTGLGNFGTSAFLALLMLAYGVLTILSSLQTVVCITVAGNYRLLPIIIFEKRKAEEIAGHINEMIAGRYSDTNVHKHTEKAADRIVDAIKNIR